MNNDPFLGEQGLDYYLVFFFIISRLVSETIITWMLILSKSTAHFYDGDLNDFHELRIITRYSK